MELLKGQLEVLNHLKDEKVNRVIWSNTMGGGSTTGCIISLLTLANETENGLFIYVFKKYNSGLAYINNISRHLGIEIYFDENKNEITINNGSRILFLSIDSPKCVFLDIFRIDLICFDSMWSFGKYSSIIIDKALENKKAKILILTNPNNKYISEKFHNRFLKNELLENEKFVFSSLVDNTHLPKMYIDNLKEIIDNKSIVGIWETVKL